MTNLIIHYFDLFGTAVFAVTGALCGVRHRLDLLGVVVFGCTVGVGGGILRDAIIGAVPVAALKDKSYLLLCIITALAVFFIARKLSNLSKVIAIKNEVLSKFFNVSYFLNISLVSSQCFFKSKSSAAKVAVNSSNTFSGTPP